MVSLSGACVNPTLTMQSHPHAICSLHSSKQLLTTANGKPKTIRSTRAQPVKTYHVLIFYECRTVCDEGNWQNNVISTTQVSQSSRNLIICTFYVISTAETPGCLDSFCCFHHPFFIFFETLIPYKVLKKIIQRSVGIGTKKSYRRQWQSGLSGKTSFSGQFLVSINITYVKR